MEVISQDRRKEAEQDGRGKIKQRNKGEGGEIKGEKRGKISKYLFNCFFNLHPEVTETSVHLFNNHTGPDFGSRAALPKLLVCWLPVPWSRAHYLKGFEPETFRSLTYLF